MKPAEMTDTELAAYLRKIEIGTPSHLAWPFVLEAVARILDTPRDQGSEVYFPKFAAPGVIPK